jgi:hypothetical protein
MAWTVNSAFDEFFLNINLSGDHRDTANARRDHVVSSLKKELDVIEAFNSGSIHRFTALKGYSDVDVIVALHFGKHIDNRTPIEVLQSVRDALGQYRTNVRKNGQAVTLYYATWPNVDIVPASHVVDNFGNVLEYQIPDANTQSWISTNPKIHTSDIESKSSICGSSFRKIIKMIKWWNKKHSDYLQSYHVEVIALKVFDSKLDDMPWDVFQYFDKAIPLLSSSLWHDRGYADSYLSRTDRFEVIKRLETARDTARTAWHLAYKGNNNAGAIREWRKIFGEKFPSYG